MKAIRARRRRQFWSGKYRALMRARYARGDLLELADSVDHTVHQIYAYAKVMGLKRDPALVLAKNQALGDRLRVLGMPHRYPKGHVPANKGLRRPGWAPGRMAETQFKKGQRGNRWLPIGTVRVNVDGYLERKFAEYLPGIRVGSQNWEPVHRRVWIDAHGPVPAGHKVVFRDGKRITELERITPAVLELVTDAELMRRNSFHNRYPKEIGLVIQARGALMRQINKRQLEKVNGRKERRRERRRAAAPNYRAAQSSVRHD